MTSGSLGGLVARWLGLPPGDERHRIGGHRHLRPLGNSKPMPRESNDYQNRWAKEGDDAWFGGRSSAGCGAP